MNNQHNFIENELIILTKQTLDIFLKQRNPDELIALYTFYYYTAKWQATNQPKCTTEYSAKALGWGRHKTIRVKKQLLDFGLIEDVRAVDPKTKRVVGYYVKMNYVLKKDTVENINNPRNPHENFQSAQKPHTGNQTHRASLLKSHTLENEHTNALSTNKKNALSTDISKERNKERKEEIEKVGNVPFFGNENNSQLDKETPLASPNAPVGVGHGPAKRSKRVEKTRENQKSFDELIDSYTENPVLREELKEHLKTRRAKRAALNNHAIELSLKRLDELTGSTKEKIKIVQNSIINGWTGFYPLSPDAQKRLDKPSYDLSKYDEDDIDPNDDRYVFFDWTPINPDD